MSGKVDPIAKQLMRGAYRSVCGFHTIANSIVPRNKAMRVFYGGALSGDVGGPLVKVQRLSAEFPNTRWGYDLVYLLSNTPYLPTYALRFLRWQGIPTVLNQNGVFYPAWFAGDWASRNALMAIAHREARWVFYQSNFARRCSEIYLGKRTGSSEVLYNAVDTGRFIPATREGLKFRFLHTGKIGTDMGYRVHAVIRGLASARRSGLDAELLVAGALSPDVRSSATEMARSYGIEDNVLLRGPYTQREGPQVYADADAYISMTFNDVCPNAVLEALACGLPVVHSNSGGVPELVGSEAGVGVDCPQSFEQVHVPDPDAIGQAMIKVVDNHARMSHAARDRCVERFDMKHWIKRHTEVFAELLGNQGIRH